MTVLIPVLLITVLAALLTGFGLSKLLTPQRRLKVASGGVLVPSGGILEYYSGMTHFYMTTRQQGFHVEDADHLSDEEWGEYLDHIARFGQVELYRGGKAEAVLMPYSTIARLDHPFST